MEELELSIKQYRAALILLTGATNREAGEQVGVGEEAVKKWRKLPNFQKILRDSTLAVFNDGLAKITLLLDTAIGELQNILLDPEASQKTKLSAIALILSHASLAKNLALEERLQTLEDLLNANRIQN